MNKQTYGILEDAISKSGRWIALEVVGDSIYLDFSKVQLYNQGKNKRPDSIHDSEISIRFADNSLFSILYNDEDKIKFLENTNGKDNNFLIEFDKGLEYDKFKFQDFKFLSNLDNHFENEIIFLDNFKSSNPENIPDFILSFISEGVAVCVGGNSLNFFNDFESLNDFDILELSNKWMRYYLKYWQRRDSIRKLPYDPICEAEPLRLK